MKMGSCARLFSVTPPRSLKKIVAFHSSGRMLSVVLLALAALPALGQHKNSGGLTGVVFLGADNAVVLTRGQAPQAGARAAAGATVSVGSVSGKTDSTGAFTVKDVPAGSATLHVATAEGAAGDLPVTIFGGATAQLGAPAVTRAAALAAVRNALSAITMDPKVTIILGPQEPLPVETMVAPAYGGDNGQPNAALNYTARTEQWFIYVDPNVLALFQHPVLFFFVDASTGTLTKLNETSWPLINGLGWYGSRDAILKSPDLLVAPQFPSRPSSAARAPLSGNASLVRRRPWEVPTLLRRAELIPVWVAKGFAIGNEQQNLGRSNGYHRAHS